MAVVTNRSRRPQKYSTVVRYGLVGFAVSTKSIHNYSRRQQHKFANILIILSLKECPHLTLGAYSVITQNAVCCLGIYVLLELIHVSSDLNSDRKMLFECCMGLVGGCVVALLL
jgi:hypothetical protein